MFTSGRVHNNIGDVINEPDGNATCFAIVVPVVDRRQDWTFEDQGREDKIDTVFLQIFGALCL